jgi:hypothetical protein
MNSLTRIKNDARACRTQLTKSIQEVRHRLSFAQLADDALAGLDSQLGFLGRAKSAIKRNPLLAAGLLAGAGWLVSDASQGRGRGGLHGSNRPRHSAKSVNTTKLKGEPR